MKNLTQDNIAQLIEDADSFELLQKLGDYCISVEDYTTAQHCYGRAAQMEPDEAGPYVGIGVVGLQQDCLDEAEVAFKVAVRLDPKCSKAYSGLAMTAHRMGDCKRAFDMYLKSLELDMDNLTALLGLFQISCQIGSFEKIIYYLKVYLKMYPKDTSVMFTLAVLYMKDDRLKCTRKVLSELLDIEPDNRDAINLLEEIEHNLNKKNMKTIKAK